MEALATTSRRMFVSGLLAAAPSLALAKAAGQPERGAGDPVWGQIMSDLQRIYAELSADPARRDSLRALESTLHTYGAYSTALGNPRRIQRAVAARLRTDRREFLEEAQRLSSRDHRDAEMRRVLPNYQSRSTRRLDPTIEELDQASAALARSGHIPVLLSTARLARALSEQKPQPIARVRAAAAQWDLCDQMEAEIAALTFLTGIVCAMTVINPALAPECAALGATLAVMELTYFIFCTWL